MTPLQPYQEPLQRAGEALSRLGTSMGDFIRAMIDFAVAVLPSEELLKIAQKEAEIVNALKEAPPRVRHLAQHSKKYRTRKKNINRALREHLKTK